MKKILIVEDDVDIHNLIKDILKKERYDVISAYSGTEAILLIEKNNVDLILLDLMLPGLSGEELIRKIKDIPIIVLSAKVSSEDKVNVLSNGANDYITKPFDANELLARIKVQLRINKNNKVETLSYKDMRLDRKSHILYIKNEKIYLTKDKTIEKLAIGIAQMYGRLNNFEDLKQEVYLKLIENGGKIETNLSYDKNLVINVLMKGIKYAMFNYLSKNKFEISLIQQTADGYFDLLDVIEDNTYNPQDVFENSNTDTLLSSEDITDQHREFYEVLKRYSDILIDNREKGLEKIAQIFDISVETVMQKMIELQTIAINSQLVKFDSKGRVLLNEVI